MPPDEKCEYCLVPIRHHNYRCFCPYCHRALTNEPDGPWCCEEAAFAEEGELIWLVQMDLLARALDILHTWVLL